MVGGPSRRSGSGLLTLLRSVSGRGTLLYVHNWSGDAPGGLEVVRGPYRRSVSGWGTLPKVRKWSENPPGGPEVVGGPSRRCGIGRGTLPEVRKWSG